MVGGGIDRSFRLEQSLVQAGSEVAHCFCSSFLMNDVMENYLKWQFKKYAKAQQTLLALSLRVIKPILSQSFRQLHSSPL